MALLALSSKYVPAPILVHRLRDPRVRSLGLLPGAQYVAVDIELRPGDLGVLVTDGITEALEGLPMTVPEALRGRGAPTGTWGSPAEIADDLLRLAGEAPGPLGAEGWEDDRTAPVFRFEPGPEPAPTL